MTKNDKIIIASTIAIIASTAVIVSSTKKYESASQQVISELREINYLLSKSREDVLSGNAQIVSGNHLLQELIKTTLVENHKNDENKKVVNKQ